MTDESKAKKKASGKDGGWAWMVCAAYSTYRLRHYRQNLFPANLYLGASVAPSQAGNQRGNGGIHSDSKAVLLYNAVIAATYRCLGIFFLQFSDLFDDDPAKTALIGTTFSLCCTIVAPISGRLEDELSQKGLRVVILVSSLTAVLGFSAAAWGQHTFEVILTFGLLSGISVGIADPAILSFIGFYFEERRSFACGISFAGASLGGLVLPPLVTWIASLYGCRGAVMILAGAWLHLLIVAAACGPVKLEKQQRAPAGGRSDSGSVDAAHGTNHEDGSYRNVTAVTSVKAFACTAVTDNSYHCPQPGSITGNPVRGIGIPEDSPREEATPEAKVNRFSKGETFTIHATGSKEFHGRFREELHDYCSFVCRKRFIILAVSFALAGFSSSNAFFLLPQLVDELGQSNNFASQIIMIVALTELISRPIFGLLSDRLEGKKVYLLFISYIITALANLSIIFTLTRLSLVIYAVIFGMFGGVYIQFIIPMLMEVSPDSNVSRVAGFLALIVGTGASIGQPLISWLNEVYGTHLVGLSLLTVSSFVAVLIITVLTACTKTISKREKTYDVTGAVNMAFEGTTENVSNSFQSLKSENKREEFVKI